MTIVKRAFIFSLLLAFIGGVTAAEPIPSLTATTAVQKPKVGAYEFLTAYHQFFLGRRATIDDKEFMDYWVNYLNGPPPNNATTAAFSFYNSPEGQARFKKMNNHKFVHVIYRAMLFKDPEPNWLRYWKAHLESGKSRQWFIFQISRTNRFRESSLHLWRLPEPEIL